MLNYGLSLVVLLKLESNSATVMDFHRCFIKEDLNEFGGTNCQSFISCVLAGERPYVACI